MISKNLEDNLKVLEDVSGATRFRTQIKELEEELEAIKGAQKGERREAQENNTRLSTSIKPLKARVTELEGFRIAYCKDSYTLKEFNNVVQARFDNQVKKRINKQALALSDKRLPSLIEAEIQGYPAACSEMTSSKIEERASHLLNDYLRNPSMWPSWFKVQVRDKVEENLQERMDQVFWDNVKQSSDQEINQRLPDAWNSFLREKATSFIKNTLQTQLLSFMVTIQYKCNKCGELVEVTITPDILSRLIQKGRISSACPYSKGLFKHSVWISLGELFWYIIYRNLSPIREISYSEVRENES